MLIRSLLVVTVLFATAASAKEPAPSKHQWVHKPGEQLSLVLEGKTIWSYHFTADGGFPHFHPVATAGGTVLTEFAPADHRWHRGVWFSWKYLNGVNYWDWGGKKVAVPDGITRLSGKESVARGDDSCTVAMNLEYSTADKVVLKEKRQITIGLPRDDGSYTIDWHMTFTAAEKDVVFDRTPPEKKTWGGYGGLSFRAAKSMGNQRVIDSEGRTGKAGHGKRARWMDFSGTVDDQGTAAGVAMFDHPSNPRHPTPWYVSTGGMGYFNPAFLFHEPYTLPAGKSFTLRYRMLVHTGAGDAAALKKEYEAFKAQ